MPNDKKVSREKVVLSAEEMAALEEGIELAKDGQRWTWSEVQELAKKRREHWKDVPEKKSA